MLLDKESGGFQAFDFGLDRRLIKAVARLGYVYPTLVQSKAIPLALEGKDLLVRARTGSGKTAAFALPALHKVLLQKEQQQSVAAAAASGSGPAAGTRRARAAAGAPAAPAGSGRTGGVLAVILVPTKELCDQTYRTFHDLSYYCRDLINVQALVGDNLAAQQALLRDEPDVLIATPSRLLTHLQAGNISLKESVQTLVMDEADLILSFGYDEDVKAVVARLPRIYQGMLMSATLSPELDDLKRVVLHSPAILKLEEGETDGELLQFFVSLPEEDKYLLLFVFLKLGVLEGKGLFFVNTLDACYRLKLFLEQFSIRSAVLNAELPLNSRIHTIQEYNRGVFDYLIATDESMDAASFSGSKKRRRSDSDDGGESSGGEEEQESEAEAEAEAEEEEGGKGKGKKGKGKEGAKAAAENEDEKDYGVHRGVDFQAVSFVVNVDFPRSARSYTHRVGRTARGGANGTALSLVAKGDERQAAVLAEVQASQPAMPLLEGDSAMEALPSGAEATQTGMAALRAQPAPLAFDLRELEGFRYRVEDVKRAVTRVAVREARLAEIKQELLNSEALKGHFEQNPHEFQILRHDKGLLPSHRVHEHLKHVPDYLLPEGMRVGTDPSAKKKKRRRGGKKRAVGQGTDRQRRKDNDPLQSFGDDQRAAAAAGAVAVGAERGEGDEGDGGAHAVEEEDYESGDDGGEEGEGEDRIYQSTEGLGESTAGRVRWKMAHKKGKWNKYQGKKPEKKKFTRF